MTEQHLLFAVLAFESDLIDLVQLTSACRAWASDKSHPLAELLVANGWLTERDREFVESLVARKLAKHQGDPRITLLAVARGEVTDAIKEVEDSEIQDSLSTLKTNGPVLIETLGEITGSITTDSDRPTTRYTWVSEVGKGGLGKVWLARDNDLARDVALKEVKSGSMSPEAVRRLIKEAQITGQLQHPNIVPVYEVHRGRQPFYTMKLVKGETLTKVIRRHHEQLRAGHGDPLSLPHLLTVFVNVCEALAYAHSRGIIHRDLKPDNIVLGDYGEAIVLDWGLAKQIGSADEETATVVLTEDAQSLATMVGHKLGTPGYMAPEQAAGRVDLLDQRTDVYGLGAILFEILTGHQPHRAPKADQSNDARTLAEGETAKPPTRRFTVHDLMQRICEEETPRVRDLDATISRELDAVCATAMAKKRDERYPDAKALAADVKRSLAYQPVSVYRAGLWERLRLWRRRNPAVAALSLFLALSLLTGSAVSTVFGLAANREARRANDEASHAIREQAKAIELSLANAALAEQERAAREKAVLNAERANEQTRRGQRLLYAANLNLAQGAWENNHVGRLRDLLNETRPQSEQDDLRGFEWHYWNRLAQNDQLSLHGHTGSVLSVAWSADGKRLASASDDQTAKVWDVTSGQELLTLKGHTGWVLSIAWSADGKRLASASDDQTIKLWDASSGQELLTLPGHTGAVRSVVWSADGKRLVSASDDQTLKVWDATSGQVSLTLKGHTNAVSSVALSADGKRLASASVDLTAKIWDAASGQELRTLKGHSDAVQSVAFDTDGKRLASASRDQTVKVWDAISGQETLTLKGHTSIVTSVTFSADGTRLASASADQTVKIWDAVSGQVLLTLKGHNSGVASVAFSANRNRLASASWDHTVKVWETKLDPETLTLKGHSSGAASVAFSADGKRLASASDDQTVKVWDTISGQERLTLKGHTGQVWGVAFSPDGKRLASASWDKTVKVWDATNGQELLTLKGHSGMVFSVAFRADGKQLASASWDKTVKLWDAVSGQELLTLKGHTGPVKSVVFSADGKQLASASWDKSVKLWDVASGQERHTLKGHTGQVWSVAFRADGQRLASASWDQTVKLWDVTSGEEILTLKGHTNHVMSVAFSADGKRLASASADQTVKLWDTTSGQETLTLKGHAGNVWSVALSADEQRLASANSDGTVKVWDARPWTPDLRTEREALSLIHWLRDQGQPPTEWLATIAADQTLSPPVRARAQQFAREF